MLHRVSTRLWMSAGLAASLALGNTASADFIYTLNNTPGLISHWSLNETTGNTVYDSVTDDAIDGANNGTFGAGASLGAPGPSGPGMVGFAAGNSSMDFSTTLNNTKALVMSADADFATLTELSMSMWFRITGDQGEDGTQYYLGGYSQSNGGSRYGFVLNHDDDNDGLRAYTRFQHPTSSTQASANIAEEAAGTYRDEKWHFAVMTVEDVGSNKHTKLYVDGVLDGPLASVAAAGWKFALRNTLSFGRDSDTTNDRHMVGQLDEISIFNRALTASEVSALYASAFQPLQVPEPSTICMVLAAAAGALVWRRRMA